MKITKRIMIICFMFMCLAYYDNIAYAQQTNTGWEESGRVTKDTLGNLICKNYSDGIKNTEVSCILTVNPDELKGLSEITFTSSNPSVCDICPGYEKKELLSNGYYVNFSTLVRVQFGTSYGSAIITAKIGNNEYSVTAINIPKTVAKISSIKDYNYNSVLLEWSKVDSVSGYIIQRANTANDNWGNGGVGAKTEIVQVVEGTDTLSTVVKADKEVEYAYLVCPKITVYGIDYYFSRSSYSKYNHSAKENFYLYKFIFDGAKINSAVANGTTIQLEWEKDLYVSSYEIYCADSETSSFQLIYTENNAENNSYVFTGEMGKTFYFKIVYIYPEEQITSNERSSYIAGNNATKKAKISLKQYAKEGQYYGGDWSSPDDAYYYQKNSKLHVVSRNKYSLIDCELDNNLKISSKKIIKLGKFANWGGFYYGTDGKYYVVVGDNNKKHSKKKVVIKVKQYSNDWHLLKTCNIKGDASNEFPGITFPFDGGNCRMAMFNSTLYLFTCREMFSGHQSNISFAIDTNNMTYQLANEDYTSHSFNQFVKFDNGKLYLSNHGDAYDRAVNLTMVTDYATPKASIQTILPFIIKGKCGDNYTGLMEGGMEISANNVLIAGISVPQNYKVAGVSGNKHSYAKNVFLTVVNKSTGEYQVKWLTAYNPKKSKVEVGEVRLVKLSDEYIVLMYSTKKKNKSTLHYLVLNQNGDIVYSKNYGGMIFTGGTQPILYNGSIVWSDVKETYNKKSGKYKCTTYMYSIPAKVREQ